MAVRRSFGFFSCPLRIHTQRVGHYRFTSHTFIMVRYVQSHRDDIAHVPWCVMHPYVPLPPPTFLFAYIVIVGLLSLSTSIFYYLFLSGRAVQPPFAVSAFAFARPSGAPETTRRRRRYRVAHFANVRALGAAAFRSVRSHTREDYVTIIFCFRRRTVLGVRSYRAVCRPTKSGRHCR